MTENRYKLIPYLVIVVLVLYIFISSSDNPKKTTTQKIIVPEKKGEFKTPTAIINPKSKKDSIVWKEKIIRTENPFNKKLAEDFILSQKENDSLKSLKLYLEAIKEVDGTYVFNDNNVRIEFLTKTRGEILKVSSTYKIKEREEILQVKQKESVFALYVGGGMTTTTSLNKLTPNVNLGIQNKRGDVLSLNYGVTDKSIGLNYTYRIINIKK